MSALVSLPPSSFVVTETEKSGRKMNFDSHSPFIHSSNSEQITSHFSSNEREHSRRRRRRHSTRFDSFIYDPLSVLQLNRPEGSICIGSKRMHCTAAVRKHNTHRSFSLSLCYIGAIDSNRDRKHTTHLYSHRRHFTSPSPLLPLPLFLLLSPHDCHFSSSLSCSVSYFFRSSSSSIYAALHRSHREEIIASACGTHSHACGSQN